MESFKLQCTSLWRDPSRKERRDRSNDSSGRTFVIGGIATALGSVFIVFVGIVLAHFCLFILQPECITKKYIAPTATASASMHISRASNSSGTVATLDTAPKSKFVIGVISSTINSEPPAKEKLPPPLFPATAKFPPQCTSEQLDVLAQQLPAEGCVEKAKRPWRFMDCSFSQKTICGNANPHWFYDFVHESSNDDTFRGIVVGCNKGYEAVELLRIASPPSDKNKYNLDEWKKEFSKVDGDEEIDHSVDCPISGATTSNTRGSKKNLHIYCIDSMPKTVAHLEKTKMALGYGDELDITKMVLGDRLEEDGINVKRHVPIAAMRYGHHHWTNECAQKPETCILVPLAPIDYFIDTKPALRATAIDTETELNTSPPIHILSIAAEGSDYEILKGAAQNLGRIQYIDFGYHWNWRWGKYSFKDLIFRLKKKGFVCYFTGAGGLDMWRITDCWQDHYDIKFPAMIGCANANIPAAEPLLEKMENIFLETLKKTN